MITKQIPAGVKASSVIWYIFAAFTLLSGIMYIVDSNRIASIANTISTLSGKVSPGMVIAVGVFYIVFAVLYFLMARGLWKGKKWARITAIIFGAIGIINGIFIIAQGQAASAMGISNIIVSAVQGVVGGYLWSSKKAKSAFF